MHLRHFFIRALKLASALSLIGLVALPVRADENSRDLRAPPVHSRSIEGQDFHLLSAHPRDAAGQPIVDIPASRVDVHDGMGDWEKTSDATLPLFKLAIPSTLRKQVALIYADETGWIVVPRGWRVQRTAVGADGNSVFSFVATAGPAKGWLSLVNIPACLGCIYEAADGLFPGVHEKLNELLGTSISEPILSPKPATLRHLNPCTVLLSYRLPPSASLHIVTVFNTQGDPSFSELDLALPDTHPALADFLLTTYLGERGACNH